MTWLLSLGLKISKSLYAVSGVVLVWMMLLTAADVVLRAFGRPITGAYELVGFSGAVVIGFGLPYTSWTRGHVYMEFLIKKLPKQSRDIANVFTRLVGIALFAVIAYNLVVVGMDLRGTGEMSPTLQLPFYPVAYGVGICCFMLCLMLLCDIIKICGDHYE
jgi:TRAP-type C4-dicarboxylate transport system permease small subunit